MHLLIPYVQLPHKDPDFEEFTYGDNGQRARKLKADLAKGDYVFFHTSHGGKKYITAYYVVDCVLDTLQACKLKAIRNKYKNPHIMECLEGKRPLPNDDDAVVFGDPITSHAFDKPLLFDRKLAEKLSLRIAFPTNRSESQVIGSATRAWRRLSTKDVDILLDAVSSHNSRVRPAMLRSAEEVAETQEKDIEDYVADNPELIGTGLKLIGRQLTIGTGRLDLLFEDKNQNLVIVELKFNPIGRKAIRQIQDYISHLRKHTKNKVSGIILCSGVMPAYRDDLRKQKKVKILVYGWKIQVKKW